MKLLVLMGQRECRYEGEYAPEALAVMAEGAHDENPHYLNDALSENRDSGEFTAVEIVTIEVPTSEIERVLNPSRSAIAGEVTNDNP